MQIKVYVGKVGSWILVRPYNNINIIKRIIRKVRAVLYKFQGYYRKKDKKTW